jgi:secretion/DNA translocation related TadE-like protein
MTSPAVPRLRRPSGSQAWSSCCWCAYRALGRLRCRSDVSTRPGRPRAWRRVATTDRPRRGPSLPTVLRCNYAATANMSSPPSPPDPRCSRGLPSRGKQWPHWSRVNADRGSATLVAVAMVAVLLAITVACVYLGSAVTARHRAQAAADLAALAAAGRLAQGADAACAHAVAVAVAMQATVADCAVDGLDIVVAVDVTSAMGRLGTGTARAVARAGPGEVMAARFAANEDRVGLHERNAIAGLLADLNSSSWEGHCGSTRIGFAMLHGRKLTWVSSSPAWVPANR